MSRQLYYDNIIAINLILNNDSHCDFGIHLVSTNLLYVYCRKYLIWLQLFPLIEDIYWTASLYIWKRNFM